MAVLTKMGEMGFPSHKSHQGGEIMSNSSRIDEYSAFAEPSSRMWRQGVITTMAIPFLFSATLSWGADRSGKEVVGTVCVNCHGTGKNGSPKIGDRNAWDKRSAQGLTTLTQHALNGIRKMPAHGGNPELSNLEIERAVTYLVNQTGKTWIEPVSKTAAAPRTGQQVVQAKCIECHGVGKFGAPKIGDQQAWIGRVSLGLDKVVSTAIRGHGAMPPRGGMADLTDPEIRSAVIYMFNQSTATAKAY
jgi:cytochrome c5